MKQEFYPTDMEDHVRIDKYLAEACPDLSRSYIQKLLKSGQVLVNGQGVKASYIVEEDDRIELEVPEAVEPEIDAEPMDLDILYEDQDLILINKPKGMVVHPAAGHYSHTLVNGLMYHCKDQLSGINGVMRPGIVHRIDMDTTGVIIACKMIWPTAPSLPSSRNTPLPAGTRRLSMASLQRMRGPWTRPLAAILWSARNEHQLSERQECSNPLQGSEPFQAVHPCGVQAGDRPHPSDSRPHGQYPPSSFGGCCVRACQVSHKRSLRTDTSCRHPGVHSPQDRRIYGIFSAPAGLL